MSLPGVNVLTSVNPLTTWFDISAATMSPSFENRISSDDQRDGGLNSQSTESVAPARGPSPFQAGREAAPFRLFVLGLRDLR